MQEIGDYKSWPPFIALFLHFPAGWLADRFHPLRVYTVATAWAMLGTFAQCVWIFRDFGHDGNLIMLYVVGLSTLPFLSVAEAAELPMYMRLLPKDRYGQFASANGMIRALARIFFSVLMGMFIGAMAPWFGERRYTWVAGWQLFFQAVGVVFLVMLYRQWKQHGGNTNYIPPGTEAGPPPSAFPVVMKH
jgi:nitrate/nitrite transporter NarK